MRNSTYWSLLCLALAAWNMAQGRDIGGNVFLAALFVIQGLNSAEPEDARIRAILTSISAAILAAALAHRAWT